MKQPIVLTYSLLCIALIMGMAAGYALSPGYPDQMLQEKSMSLGPVDRWFDARYIDAMAAHHRGAMLLAQQAKGQSTRHEILGLAQEILTNEPKLIEELYGWKRAWYKDNRQAKDPIVANLATYDEKFDLRFLNALIAHHEAGIAMTQETRMKSSNKDVLNNADAVENFLRTTMGTLKEWRKAWYQVE